MWKQKKIFTFTLLRTQVLIFEVEKTLYKQPCRPGYYCAGGNEVEIECPRGSYCPYDYDNDIGKI